MIWWCLSLKSFSHIYLKFKNHDNRNYTVWLAKLFNTYYIVRCTVCTHIILSCLVNLFPFPLDQSKSAPLLTHSVKQTNPFDLKIEKWMVFEILKCIARHTHTHTCTQYDRSRFWIIKIHFEWTLISSIQSIKRTKKW